MYTRSTSGRSSRSTLMETKCPLRISAMASFSNDSRSITWHQWHVEYPTDRKIGLSSCLALANASSPHGYQSTGLRACCNRYGLFSPARRFLIRNVGQAPGLPSPRHYRGPADTRAPRRSHAGSPTLARNPRILFAPIDTPLHARARKTPESTDLLRSAHTPATLARA